MNRKEAIKSALEAIGHIREEADFNRSWADGRRGPIGRETPAYYARRIEIAEERDCWAEAIALLANMPGLPEVRCDACDNGIEAAWKFCAWCGSEIVVPEEGRATWTTMSKVAVLLHGADHSHGGNSDDEV